MAKVMLKCGPTRSSFIETQGQKVYVHDYTTRLVPVPRNNNREPPKVKFNYKLVKTFEHSSKIQCLDSVTFETAFVFGHQDGSVVYYRDLTAEPLILPARQQRGCTSVKLSSEKKLAIGHDKVRNDASLTVMDIETQSNLGLYANSEAISSVCWMREEPSCILTGVNHRWIRIFDTRMDTKDTSAVMSIPATAVYEITCDYDSFSYASTCDNNILLWDRRKPDLPVLSLKSNASSHSCRVNQLRHDPSKRGHLTALSDDGTLDLWQFGGVEEQDFPTYVHQHDYKGSKGRTGFDFVDFPAGRAAWNLLLSTEDPQAPELLSIDTRRLTLDYSAMGDLVLLDEGRLKVERSPVRGILEDTLDSSTFPTYVNTAEGSDSDESSEVSSEDGQAVVEAPKQERFSKAYHPLLSRQLSGVMTTQLEKNKSVTQSASRLPAEDSLVLSTYRDVSSSMYRRAIHQYGLDTRANSAMMVDSSLKTVWKWLSWSSIATKDDKLTSGDFDFAYEGCLNIWKGIGGNPRKSKLPYSRDFFDAVEDVNQNFATDIFPESVTRAPLRQLALTATGWCMTTAEFVVFQDKLIEDSEYAKAAFYSVAQSRDVQRAIEILTRAGTRMDEAVSEYLEARGNDEAGRAWYDLCEQRGIDMDSPYIRAIFAYLSANDWRDVIDEQGLTLRERVALALRYLKDEEVGPILQDLCRTESAEGNLEGLLLTGINLDALDLLQAYVDRTADVQTAALIVSLKPALQHEKRVQQWISEYRSFLTVSGLHLERCRLDAGRTKASRSSKHSKAVAKQISIRCNHCNAIMDLRDQTNDHHGRLLAQKSSASNGTMQSSLHNSGKLTLCPHCRKSLPRCVLCFLPVGAESLICICLTCNHSMHDKHADDWFAKHSKCPASQCACECRSRDHV